MSAVSSPHSQIVFVHGTGITPSPREIVSRRDAFVHGVREGLLASGKLDVNDLAGLSAHDSGLGLDTVFVDYQKPLQRRDIAPGKPVTPGSKLRSVNRPLRFTCTCCWSRSGVRLPVPDSEWAQGQFIRRQFPLVRRFLKDTAFKDAVVGEVLEQMPASPRIVVAHSLGTVVTLAVLARLTDDRQPAALVTLGSPLPLEYVFRRLESHELRWAQQHAPVWVNVHDTRDPVTGGDNLPRDRFPEVVNLRVRNRPDGGHHSAKEYLGHRAVANTLWSVASAQPAFTDHGGQAVAWSDVRGSQLVDTRWNLDARISGKDLKRGVR